MSSYAGLVELGLTLVLDELEQSITVTGKGLVDPLVITEEETLAAVGVNGGDSHVAAYILDRVADAMTERLLAAEALEPVVDTWAAAHGFDDLDGRGQE